MARGAVVVILADGWETGSPERLRRALDWDGGGVACDAVVSTHRLDAIKDTEGDRRVLRLVLG